MKKNLIALLFFTTFIYLGVTVMWLFEMEENQGKIEGDRNFMNALAAQIYEAKHGEEPKFSIQF